MKKLMMIALVLCLIGSLNAQPIPSFTDDRNDRTYTTVKMGSQVWMVENLNFDSGTSWCHGGNNTLDEQPENCSMYGRLYDWHTAAGVCPSGWHLPTAAEWAALVEHLGGWKSTARKLKSSQGWEAEGDTDAGSHTESLFDARPAGTRSGDGRFVGLGTGGYWWSASEANDTSAFVFALFYDSDDISWYEDYKGGGFSVRCIKD